MLKSRGKTAVFWYEPMGKYPDGVIVTTWRGGHTPKTVANTTGDKVDVICAPNGKCYFDYPQLPGDWPSGQPDTGWMPSTSWKTCTPWNRATASLPKKWNACAA